MTYIEAWKTAGPELVPLTGDRVTIGKDPSNALCIGGDSTVSRLHALLERFPSGWCVSDLGSRNGTYVNGERVVGKRALRPGDEIRVGQTRLVFRGESGTGQPSVTAAVQAPPDMTRREREVLVALCRPVLQRSMLTEPASIRQIAAELVITESAVKKHLGRLYDKFGLHEEGGRRLGRLAHDAIRRGAVGLSDVTSQ